MATIDSNLEALTSPYVADYEILWTRAGGLTPLGTEVLLSQV